MLTFKRLYFRIYRTKKAVKHKVLNLYFTALILLIMSVGLFQCPPIKAAFFMEIISFLYRLPFSPSQFLTEDSLITSLVFNSTDLGGKPIFSVNSKNRFAATFPISLVGCITEVSIGFTTVA